MSKETTNDPADVPSDVPSHVPKISPARLHTVIAGLWFCLFIAALDTTIVTTALIKISSGFDSLEQGAWLITTYLLTYNSECLRCQLFRTRSDCLQVS